ncbi:hypothetical protein RUND412_002750 [Rhizina undulata]
MDKLLIRVATLLFCFDTLLVASPLPDTQSANPTNLDRFTASGCKLSHNTELLYPNGTRSGFFEEQWDCLPALEARDSTLSQSRAEQYKSLEIEFCFPIAGQSATWKTLYNLFTIPEFINGQSCRSAGVISRYRRAGWVFSIANLDIQADEARKDCDTYGLLAEYMENISAECRGPSNSDGGGGKHVDYNIWYCSYDEDVPCDSTSKHCVAGQL